MSRTTDQNAVISATVSAASCGRNVFDTSTVCSARAAMSHGRWQRVREWRGEGVHAELGVHSNLCSTAWGVSPCSTHASSKLATLQARKPENQSAPSDSHMYTATKRRNARAAAEPGTCLAAACSPGAHPPRIARARQTRTRQLGPPPSSPR